MEIRKPKGNDQNLSLEVYDFKAEEALLVYNENKKNYLLSKDTTGTLVVLKKTVELIEGKNYYLSGEVYKIEAHKTKSRKALRVFNPDIIKEI